MNAGFAERKIICLDRRWYKYRSIPHRYLLEFVSFYTWHLCACKFCVLVLSTIALLPCTNTKLTDLLLSGSLDSMYWKLEKCITLYIWYLYRVLKITLYPFLPNPPHTHKHTQKNPTTTVTITITTKNTTNLPAGYSQAIISGTDFEYNND